MRGTKLRNLKNIERILAEFKVKSEVEELTSESTKLIEKVESRVEYSTQQIQASFDRLHDKAFNFNNITLSICLVLATFPQDKPIAPMWAIIIPVIILVFIIVLDWRQMEIHRFTSKEMEWRDKERNEYPIKIRNQSLLSLLMLILSAGWLVTLFFIIKCYHK